MDKEIPHGEVAPDYTKLVADWRSASSELREAVNLKGDGRLKIAPLAKSKVEARSRLFNPLAKIVTEVIEKKLGNIRKPGTEFRVDISADEISSQVDPIVFEAFESDIFDGISAVMDYLREQGIIEDMSSSAGPSNIYINYTSSNGESSLSNISGKNYKSKFLS